MFDPASDSKPRRSSKPKRAVHAKEKKDAGKDGAGGSDAFSSSRDAAGPALEAPAALPKPGAEAQMQAADPPPSALAALGHAVVAPPAAKPAAKPTTKPAAKPAEGPIAATKSAVVGRIGSFLVYVETEANNIYEPIKVWLVETSGRARGIIEARAGPLLQRLQAAGQPVVVYVEPVYVKVAGGVLSVRAAVGDGVVCVKYRAVQLKGDCAGRALEVYAAACERVDARYTAACEYAAAKVAPVKAKGFELFRTAEANLLPYYVKASSTVRPYYLKGKDGVQYVTTRVGGVVLNIKVAAGERAALLKTVVLSRCVAVSDFVGGYTGPVVAKLASIYEAVKVYVSDRLSHIVANAAEVKTLAWTKACGVAVVIKVKSLAVWNGVAHYPNVAYVQVKGQYVYMKSVVDGKVVTCKAKLADIANVLNATILQIKEQAKLKAASAFDTAHVKYLAMRAETRRITADPNARVAAASAMGGATVLGAGGGAAGLVAGGTFGAACGVPLSLFTFGLSIPVGAAVGGAAGMCAGAVTAGTAGLVGGGAAGHRIHQKKDSISEGFTAAANKASAYRAKVADSTAASAAYVRARLAGGTGGTGEDK